MKLTVLVDNNTRIDKYLYAEPALSFYLEIDNKKILFDCGYSDIFIENAMKLKIELREVTDIILSHRHNDHTGGLFYLRKLYQDSKELGIVVEKPLITTHPDTFDNCFEPEIGDVSCPLGIDKLKNLFEVNFSKKPVWITSKLAFLGEIPNGNNDFRDDSALVYNSSKGLVIITGCSHSGLENIIEYAKDILGEEKIYEIIGGFHLLETSDKEMNQLVSYLKKQKINFLAPCHCSDFKSKTILAKEFDLKEVCVGDVFEY